MYCEGSKGRAKVKKIEEIHPFDMAENNNSGASVDVQAEIQQYVNAKSINGIFTQLVENVLLHKPANVPAFLVEYLFKTYPDQVKAANLPTYAANIAETKNIERKNGKTEKSSKKSTTDTDDEDEHDDFEEEMKAPTSVTSQSKTRRTSVSAESMDPDKLKRQASQVTSLEKSPEITTRLLEVVSHSPLLRTLDDDQKEMIVKAFSGPLIKHPGDNIIVQGDNGDIFYLLEDGLVDVYVCKKGGPETKVHTYTPGNSFGELAIMYNAPRAATCRAQTECKLWALDRVSFKVIVVAATMRKRDLFVGFLQKVPILESLTEMEILTLADSMAEEKYNDGEVVCYQGDPGDYFYIIRDGAAICTQTDENRQEKVVADLDKGKYFGEIALLTEKPRQATVTAKGTLRVLSLDRATFTRVMGPMEDIMKRNMDQYYRYTAQSI